MVGTPTPQIDTISTLKLEERRGSSPSPAIRSIVLLSWYFKLSTNNLPPFRALADFVEVLDGRGEDVVHLVRKLDKTIFGVQRDDLDVVVVVDQSWSLVFGVVDSSTA